MLYKKQNPKGLVKTGLTAVVAVTLIVASLPAQSASVFCVGMEKQSIGGKKWNLILDLDSQKFIVNGDVIKLEYWKSIESGIVLHTVNFRDEAGRMVYDTLYIKNDDSAFLLQYRVARNNLSGSIEMACHKEGF